MTGAEFKAGREALGLTQAQLAKLVGYGSQSRIAECEKRDDVPACQARIMQAYIDGYRPPDWPA